MGASSSTIRDSVRATFVKHDAGGKGYLTLKELLRLPVSQFWGVEPCHLGVLFMADRDRDGKVALDEALAFARAAAHLSRGLRARDSLTAGAIIMGHCSLAMWAAASAPGGRDAFVAWALRLAAHGRGTPGGEAALDALVPLQAVQNLHRLFDMERRQGVSFEAFKGLLEAAAADAGLLPAEAEDGLIAGRGDHDGAGCSEHSSSIGGSDASDDSDSSSGSVGDDGGSSSSEEEDEDDDGELQRRRRRQHRGVPLPAVVEFLQAAHAGLGGVAAALLGPDELGGALASAAGFFAAQQRCEGLGGGGGGGGVAGGGALAVAAAANNKA